MLYTIRISNKSVDPNSVNLDTLYFENISPALLSNIETTYEDFISDMTITDNSIYIPLYNRNQAVKIPANSVLVINTDNTNEAIYYRSLEVNNSLILINPDPMKDSSGATLIEKTITENGTYYASDDGADGYSMVDVDVAGGSLEDSDVRFLDYDGTVVYGYTKEQFLALDNFPDNPTHEGLTSQGWNWTLNNAQDYVSTFGALDIGQLYITDDGKTRLYVYLDAASVQMENGLGIMQLEENTSVEVDWGDGSEVQVFSGDSSEWEARHTYSVPAGNYVVTVNVLSGSVTISGLGNADTYNLLYKMHIGSNVDYTDSQYTEIYTSPFMDGRMLRYITFPKGIRQIPKISDSYVIKCVILPSNTKFESNVDEYNCHCLTNICFPERIELNNSYGSMSGIMDRMYFSPNLTSLPTMENMFALSTIYVPHSVTTILTNAFDLFYSIDKIVIDNTEDAIAGAPWGADVNNSNVEVIWLRSE